MQVSYGNYTHNEGEVALRINKETLRTEADTPYATLETWTLDGVLVAGSEAAMDTAVAALETAYGSDGQDLALQLTGGGNTTLALDSSACNGGTRVTQRPSFPDFRGAAYVAYLPYSITVVGEVPISSRATNLLRFTESVSRSGGGPRFGVRETLNSRPVVQTLRRFTKYIATQSGTASGLYSYPVPPTPINPGALIEAPEVSYTTPKRRGTGTSANDYTEWTVSWTYRMESASPILGGPNIWGRNFK